MLGFSVGAIAIRSFPTAVAGTTIDDWSCIRPLVMTPLRVVTVGGMTKTTASCILKTRDPA